MEWLDSSLAPLLAHGRQDVSDRRAQLCRGLSLDLQEDRERHLARPLQFNALDNAKVKTALANARVLLRRVETSRTIGMAQIMGQTEGTFLECYKGKREAEGEEIRHCVTIDCLRRIAFCNENSVYPFCLSADPRAQETITKHNKLKTLLDCCTITLVYRVLFQVVKREAGETRVLHECAKAPQPDNKRQKNK